jgi:hypothetical protein
MHATRPDPNPAHDLAPIEVALRACGPAGCDMSLVDVVLLACDLSEDEGEINDIVDGLIDRGAARLLPAGADPMLVRLDEAA